MKMIVDVSIDNKKVFYPDFQNNLDQPEAERFGIKYRLMSQSLHSDKWSSIKRKKTKGKKSKNEKIDLEVQLDLMERLRVHAIGLINPFIIKISEIEQREVTLKDIFSDDYDIFIKIQDDFNNHLEELYSTEDEEEEIKK